MSENPFQPPGECAPQKKTRVAGPRPPLRAYVEAAADFLVILLVGAVAGNVVAGAVWRNWPWAESPAAEQAAAANPTWWVKPLLTVLGFVAAFAVLGAIQVRTILRRKRG